MSEVLNRIIQMTEVTEISHHDYIHLQSPTRGDSKILAEALGIKKFVLNNEELDTTSDGTCTCTFDEELEEGYYILSLENTTSGAIYNFLLYNDGTNQATFSWDDVNPKYSGYLTKSLLYMNCTSGTYAVFNAKLSILNPTQTY